MITIHSLSFLSPFSSKTQFILYNLLLLLLLQIIKSDAMQSREMQSHTNNYQTLPKKQEVIITVYVESPKLQNSNSHKTQIIPHNNNNHINPKPSLPKTPNSTGYDRRAQLLAYSRHLRNVHSSNTQSPQPKSKKWKWKVRSEAPTVRRMPSRRALQRWRYERVGMMREERTEVVDQPCRPKCLGGRSNKKSTSRSGSSIFEIEEFTGRVIKGLQTQW
ncbi:hypothetical protein IC582_021394 [Cucumis melo]